MTSMMTKQYFLTLLEVLLETGVITPHELSRYAKPCESPFEPEVIRQDLEEWYRNLGIENILHRRFSLSPCPFTREEIEEAMQQQECILCVPAGVTRQQLGQLFRIENWALSDPLVTPTVEKEDFWFRTSMSLQPTYIQRTGHEIKHLFEAENKVHFSLERYLVFIARMQYLTKQTPDLQYWIWLPHRAYDRSGMLIAGFDRHGTFNVHGWMPQFSASFLGARYGHLPNGC
jgi:hypothetical protein